MIGTQFGRYDIIEELGHGGMSVVYRGVDTGLEREVAIKVLHDHLAKKQENRLRLHREAKAIARLRHPNILEVFDFSNENADRAFIVMEYVRGENLRQFLDRTGTFPPEYCALLAIHLCQALKHAHEHGIIHRDLKPENIMVSSEGSLKLMDFGIAHIFDAETMTQTGSLLGSPAHMAPEMIEGEKVDERADIFALGTVLYWLVTGKLPFEGKNAPQILKRVLEGIYKNPEAVEPKVGQCFGDIIRKCLAYETEERYATMDEILADLDKFLGNIPFQDPSSELQKYLLNPSETRQAFEAHLVSYLMASAQRSLKTQNHTEAFRTFNRILAYEPKNTKVIKALQQLQRRKQGSQLAIAAAILLLGSTGVYAIYKNTSISTSIATPRITTSDSAAISNVPEDTITSAQERSRQLATELATRRAALAAEDTQTLARQFSSQIARIQSLASQRASERRSTARTMADEIRQPTSAMFVARRNNPITSIQRNPDEKTQDMGTSSDTDMGIRVEPGAKHVYKFRILPVSAILSIDGEDYEPAQAHQGIELQEGKNYPMRVDCAQGCEPYTTTLRVDGPQDPSRPKKITLSWRNGIVKIRSPRDSLLYLPGKKRRAIELKKGKEYHYLVKFGDAARSRNPQQELTFTIHDRNQMQLSYNQTVVVKPGSIQVISARF